MKLKDVAETGFYYNEEKGKNLLYEVYLNSEYIENFDTSSEEYKDYSRLVSHKYLVDLWVYDYEDAEGIKHFDNDGLIHALNEFDIEVIKDTTKYVMPSSEINVGSFLCEDKLTYKQKLEKIKEICENNKCDLTDQILSIIQM